MKAYDFKVLLEPDETGVITRFELLAGAKTARQLKHVGELLAALPCAPLDEPAAEIRRARERDGGGIGMADSLIAGIVVTTTAYSSPGTDAISNGCPSYRWAG